MAGPAAVGVDDDLAAGQAGVAHRAAEHELSGRVDQQAVVGGVHGVVCEVVQHGVDDLLADVRGERGLQVDAVGVLSGQHDGVEAHRRGSVVLHGDLGLAVGAQVVQHAALAHLGEPAREPVRQRDRQRHQLGGVLDGVAEHQALVARALGVQRVACALDAGLVGGVDALGDVGRLRADADVHAAGGRRRSPCPTSRSRSRGCARAPCW